MFNSRRSAGVRAPTQPTAGSNVNRLAHRQALVLLTTHNTCPLPPLQMVQTAVAFWVFRVRARRGQTVGGHAWPWHSAWKKKTELYDCAVEAVCASRMHTLQVRVGASPGVSSRISEPWHTDGLGSRMAPRGATFLALLRAAIRVRAQYYRRRSPLGRRLRRSCSARSGARASRCGHPHHMDCPTTRWP